MALDCQVNLSSFVLSPACFREWNILRSILVAWLLFSYGVLRCFSPSAKEERDGCFCIWGGWTWWSSNSPHSGGSEISVHDVIKMFVQVWQIILLTEVISGKFLSASSTAAVTLNPWPIDWKGPPSTRGSTDKKIMFIVYRITWSIFFSRICFNIFHFHLSPSVYRIRMWRSVDWG